MNASEIVYYGRILAALQVEYLWIADVQRKWTVWITDLRRLGQAGQSGSSLHHRLAWTTSQII